MNTSEYDQQQLFKFEDPLQLQLSTPRAYTWSQAPSLANSQPVQEVARMTYDINSDDAERDDKAQPWLISDAPTQSSTFLSYDGPLSQDPIQWDEHISSSDWDRVNKPFNPEAASFQPRQPSSDQEFAPLQQLPLTFVDAHG